ncbi:hypothetical protein BC834DRAFT_860811 [Gloeopeniophorella convolvens]|nr:hypothetical protein BC834DRAFT_860811 [Gloeopeniophorella convolvens]
MWCTRWFIPLLILPLPSAPPYFLILFLLSMIIHARPCFYCIVLLTALFLSSCYWQPIPLSSPVSSSWATNATFVTALAAALSSPIAAPLPAVIRLADRCWCDVASSRMFEPFDIARWERSSVEQLKEDMKRAERLASRGTERGDEQVDGESASPATNDTGSASWSQPTKSDFTSQTLTAPSTTLPTSAKQPAEQVSATQAPANSSGPPFVPSENMPLLRRKYDLRPYGFSMVLDFGWSRG